MVLLAFIPSAFLVSVISAELGSRGINYTVKLADHKGRSFFDNYNFFHDADPTKCARNLAALDTARPLPR